MSRKGISLMEIMFSVAILGVVCFTALVLALAAYRVRRLEINYATD